MALELYRQKRDFKKTPEPKGVKAASGKHIFVVQKHNASHLHYDFRLELGGVLKSWAVPKGPSLNPADKRLAVEVEDHPLGYAQFEGRIPENQYGAGQVIVWDYGRWIPEGNAEEGYTKGRLVFHLEGDKLSGRWTLVRQHAAEGKRHNWFLIKGNDEAANRQLDITVARPESVLSGALIDGEKAQSAPGKTKGIIARLKSALSTGSKPKTKVQAKATAKPPRAKTILPGFEVPLLPTKTDQTPSGNGWLHEKKFDGYRTLIFKQGRDVKCYTRNGHNWSAKYGNLSGTIRALPFETMILDGEIIVPDGQGEASFAKLQDALSEGKTDDLVTYVFDLLYLEGEDLRPLPLEQRKLRLEQALRPHVNASLKLTQYVIGKGPEQFQAACKAGLEGIISKKLGTPYVSDRSLNWLKTKCDTSTTLTIAGYSVEGKRRLKALIMAEEHEGEWVYVGRVGTGFNQRNLDEIMAAVESRKIAKPAIKLVTGVPVKDVTWVKPEVLAEIQFRTRTTDGLLRQASFKGLRPDKQTAPGKAKSSTVIKPVKASAAITEDDLANIVITHPERHLFGDEDITKLDVALYYAHVANIMMPHVLERPLSLIRCTSDNAKSCFFQRHYTEGMLASASKAKVTNDEGKTTDYLYISQAKGLLEFAQAGVVEVHAWNSHVGSIDQPDQIILDLDPDAAVKWPEVIQAAVDIQGALLDLGFTPFVKTTGGKGIHIVIPIGRDFGWDDVKTFTRELALGFEHRQPQRFTANMSKAKRVGKIFIDYLRNGKAATAAAPYSLRARPGGPVSMPVSWEELPKLKSPLDFTYETVPDIIKSRKNPWEDFDKAAPANLKALQQFLRPKTVKSNQSRSK